MQRSTLTPPLAARGVLAAFVALLGTFEVEAGVVLTYVQVDPGADDPTTVVVEAEGDGLRVGTGDEAVVFRADEGLLWRIDLAAETHEVIDVDHLARASAALEAERRRLAGVVPELVPGGEAEASRRLARALGSAAVIGPLETRPTGEAGFVGAFEATAHLVTGGGEAVATVWTAHPDSVGVPEDALDVADRLAEVLGSASLAGVLGRYLRDPRSEPSPGVPPGLPVRIVEHVGPRAQRRTELVSIREEALPAARFALPPGSREVASPVGL